MNTLELRKLKNNIWKNYLGAFLGGVGYFYNGIEILYYRHFDLGFPQIAWLFSLISLILLIFEIPSGAFGDLYGKKKALLIAMILNTTSSIIISATSNFWTFAIGFILWGMGAAFHSGSGAALFYDTLQKLKREKEYVKHMGRIDGIFVSLDLVSGFVGPLLFALFVRIPYFVSILGYFLSFIVYLTFYEPSRTIPIKRKGFWQTSYEQMKQSMKTAYHSRSFLYITIFTTIFLLTIAAMNNIILQPYWKEELGFPLELIAVLTFFHTPIQVSFVFFSNKLERKLGDFNSLIFIILLEIISIIGTIFYFNVIILGIFMGVGMGAGSYAYVIKDKYILHHSPEDQRATLLSANSMFNSLTIFLMLPIIGEIIEKTSLTFGLFIILLIYVCLGIIVISFKKKFE
ncbi:MAG: MFS transporter [Promethearchaeota archaeon]|jgi:MFS family permease